MKITAKCHVCGTEIMPVFRWPEVTDVGGTEPFDLLAMELRLSPCEKCLEDAVRLRFKRLMDRLISEVKS